MKALQFFIYSRLFISIAAVLLTIESQIQIGAPPQGHSYLYVIFFATLLDYNVHRFIKVLTSKGDLEAPRHTWFNAHPTWFYSLITFAFLGFVGSLTQISATEWYVLAPFAGLTLFYSLPYAKRSNKLVRLRQVPYLKIFLISFVWSCITILLPVVSSAQSMDTWHLVWMIIERFLFVFAITIPFDIRDMAIDKQAGVSTIPLFLGVNKATKLSKLALALFLIVSVIHYTWSRQHEISFAFTISFASTWYFLSSATIKRHPLYYEGILDGTLFLQGLFVIASYFLRA